jgi:hypothetical protein
MGEPMPVHTQRPEEDSGFPVLLLSLILLRQGLTLNLELSWWPSSPIDPSVLFLPTLRFQMKGSHAFYVGAGI